MRKIYLPKPGWQCFCCAVYCALCAAASSPSLAHDGVNDGWYEDLMQPGQLHGFCCTKRDCKNVTARTVGNHFEVWIDSKTFPDLPNSPFEGHAPNAWVPVPEEAILHHHDNPTGEPVACWYQQQVRCFIEGTQV